MDALLSEFKTFEGNLTKQYEHVIRRMDKIELNLQRPGGGPIADDGFARKIFESPGFDAFRQTKRGRAIFPIEGGSFFPAELKTTITSTALGS